MCDLLSKPELVRSINNSYWQEGEEELRKGEKRIVCVYDFKWDNSHPLWQYYVYRPDLTKNIYHRITTKNLEVVSDEICEL